MSQPVHLTGTVLEGGGQLLRIAIGVSALTKTPIHVTKIRGNREGAKGLKQQHLSGVKWLARASNAHTSGAEKKSLELHFRPDLQDENSHFEEVIDIGSPGSASLILQAILPVLLFSPTPNQEPRHITIKGGVNVDLSPSHEYIQHVLAPMLALIGLPPIQVSLGQREWPQKNQATGSVSYIVQPLPQGATLPAFILSDRGSLSQIQAIIIAPPRYQSELQRLIISTIEDYTKLGHLPPPTDENPINFILETPGSTKTIYVLLVAHTTSGLRLGRDRYLSKVQSSSASGQKPSSGKHGAGKGRGKSRRTEDRSQLDGAITNDALSALAESIVGDLADELAHGACVDTFMRDQLVVYQALAEGCSYVDGGCIGLTKDGLRREKESSLHAKTAEWVCEELLGRFDCGFDGNGRCDGAGWVAGRGKPEGERVQGQNAAQESGSGGEVDALEKTLGQVQLS